MAECWIIGVLDGGPETLSPQAAHKLQQADLTLGDQRFLDLFQPLFNPDGEASPLGKLMEVPGRVEAALADGRSVAILATGDPLQFGIGALLLKKLPAERLQFLGAVSNFQLAFERLKLPWQDAARLSAHSGGDQGDWHDNAGADHPLYSLHEALKSWDKIAVLTNKANGPARIARMLLHLELGKSFSLTVMERLGRADENVLRDLTPQEVMIGDYAHPNLVVLLRRADPEPQPVLGLSDDFFLKRTPKRGLITRRNVRVQALAQLELAPGDVVWDIGAGSGSVGLEAARLIGHGRVFAMEKNPECLPMIRENRRRLRLANHQVEEGRAPAGLEKWPDPDAVFIGGSGGNLDRLIPHCLERLKRGGRLVMSFITIENLGESVALLKKHGAPWEAMQASFSQTTPILDMNRMAASDPVWIVTARKDEAP